MHPIFKNTTGLLSYLAAWLALGAMLGFVSQPAGHLTVAECFAIVAPLTVLLALVCLTPWYLCRTWPFRTTPAWKLLAYHTLAAMCSSALVLSVDRFLLNFSSAPHRYWSMRFHSVAPALAAMCFLFYLLSIALHYAFQAVELSRQAEVLGREAELKALKAQVNPHFLFNSLNSISALTSLDPAKAREMCIRLSDFLRLSLRLGERTSIPFGEELALAATYLDVEQIRFGKRLRVTREFEALCAECEVPALLIQPLVENAIKHGIASLTEGGEITISARVLQDRLSFTVENPFDPDAPPQAKSGFGLLNVRNRLRARYGSAAQLEITVDQGRYRVTLTLPYAKERKNS